MLNLTEFSGLNGIVSPDAPLRRLATGYVWAEGPIWDREAQTLYYTDFAPCEIYSWREGEGVRVVRRDSERSCGLSFDRNGRILCAQTSDRSLTRFDGNSVEALASEYQGIPLNSPNDVIMRSDGTIFFTDPWSADTGLERLGRYNGVYCLRPDGTLTMEADLVHPNGLALTPDERILYVDDTKTQAILAFDVLSDGGLSGRRLFAIMDRRAGQGLADGMKVDEAGRLYVTGPGGIWVFDPDGEARGIIDVGETAANLCWGGDGLRTLFVTASSSVYALETLVRPCGTSCIH